MTKRVYAVSVQLYAESDTSPKKRIFPVPPNIATKLLKNGALDDLVRSAYFENSKVESVTRVRYNYVDRRLSFGIKTSLTAKEIGTQLREAPYEDTVYEGERAAFELGGKIFVPDLRRKTILHVRRVKEYRDTFIKQANWYS